MTALDICLCQEFQGHFCFRHICNLEQATARSRKLQRAGWILCPRGTASRLSQVHPSRYLHRQLQFLILSSLVPALSWVLVECTGQLPLEMTDTRHKDPFLSYWETLSFFNGEGTQKWRRERSDCVLHPQPSEKGEVLVPQSCPTLRPHALKPTRFPRLWDSPGKSMEWIAIPFSRGSSRPRSPALQAGSLPSEAAGKPTRSQIAVYFSTESPRMEGVRFHNSNSTSDGKSNLSSYVFL